MEIVDCIPAEIEDILYIHQDSPDELNQITTLISNTPDVEAIVRWSARSLVIDGQLLAVFGVWPMWPGVGRCWSMLPQESLRRYPKSIHKAVSTELANFIEREKLRRVEAIVFDGHEVGHRWIRRLGFEHEGLMRAYAIGGEDCHLYARVTK